MIVQKLGILLKTVRVPFAPQPKVQQMALKQVVQIVLSADSVKTANVKIVLLVITNHKLVNPVVQLVQMAIIK